MAWSAPSAAPTTSSGDAADGDRAAALIGPLIRASAVATAARGLGGWASSSTTCTPAPAETVRSSRPSGESAIEVAPSVVARSRSRAAVRGSQRITPPAVSSVAARVPSAENAAARSGAA
jgi:hypothetical protein